MGDKSRPATEVGDSAAESFIKNYDQGGCVDEFAQDQVIVFMALASGVSRVRTGKLTLHTETSIYFSEQLTGASAFDTTTVY